MTLGMLALFAGAVYGSVVTAARGKLWLTVVIVIASAVGLVAWSRRHTRVRVNQALSEWEAAARAPAEMLKLPMRLEGSLRKNLRVPVTLAVLLVGVWILAQALDTGGLLLVVSIIVGPLLVISFAFALVRSRWIATLEESCLLLPGRSIPWQAIDNVELRREVQGTARFLIVTLRTAPAPRGIWQRFNSALSGGMSDTEIRLPLLNVTADPQLVFDTAEALWRHTVGDSRADAAERRRYAALAPQITRFRDLPRPERHRQIKALIVICIAFGFLAHGVAADFLGAATWLKMSAALSALLTLGGVYWLVASRGLASLQRQNPTLGYAGAFFLALVLIWAPGWLILARSLPDLLTRVTGSPHEFTTTLQKRQGGRRCTYTIEGEFFAGRFPSRYCATAAEYAALPESGEMRVRGKVTWFGLHIDRIEPIDREFH